MTYEAQHDLQLMISHQNTHPELKHSQDERVLRRPRRLVAPSRY
uniref:Uncharacterized protein n=1 Tax=Rhizophora mucronata TaxID=61149 RepID=A0A2P2P270_RHIMU